MKFFEKLKKGEHNLHLIIFLIMFSTGLASILYEVVMISVITTVVGATELSLAIVLASFLFGIANGALIGGIFVNRKINLVKVLIVIELLIAVFGLSFLSILSEFVGAGIPVHVIFWIIIVALLIPTLLMGMEIPIAVGILEKISKKKSTGFVYFADTLGGVIGALITGLVIIPILGFHGAMFFGASLNVFTFLLAFRINKKKLLSYLILLVLILTIFLSIIFSSVGFFQLLKLRFADSFFSEGSYFHSVYFTKPVYSTNSPYQHIMILESPYYGRELYLDGHLQVSEKASLTYHEYLVLPALAAHKNPKKVLLIGGGDGGALYQLLKYDLTIDHVDLDEEVIQASKKYLPDVHRGSLDDPSVNRFIQDGRRFLKETKSNSYDIVIVDLPSPTRLGIASLYSKEFYEEVARVLKDGGVVITQFIPPYLYLEGFTSTYKTMKAVFPHVYPYVVPGSLHGSLGFIQAGFKDTRIVENSAIEGVWYDASQNEHMFYLPKFPRKYFENNSVQISTDFNPIIHMYLQNNYFYHGVADNPGAGR